METAREFAERVFAQFEDQICQEMRVPLVEFASFEDREAVISQTELDMNPDIADVLMQRLRNSELALLIIRAGAEPVFVQIVPDDYFAWLKKMGMVNSSACRAQYAAWVVSGRPDDYRSIGGSRDLDQK